MASVTVDTSEVDEYVAELKQVPAELGRHLYPVVKRAAQSIKTDLQEDFRGSSNKAIRGIAGKVTYDEPSGAPSIETEIGIDKGSHGSLGNIAVFGTWKGGGTHMHPSYYAEQELPAFTEHLASVAAELIP